MTERTTLSEAEITARNEIALRSKKQLLHVSYDGLIALMQSLNDFASRTKGNAFSTAFAALAVGLASKLVMAAGEAIEGNQDTLAEAMMMFTIGLPMLVKALERLTHMSRAELDEPLADEMYGRSGMEIAKLATTQAATDADTDTDSESDDAAPQLTDEAKNRLLDNLGAKLRTTMKGKVGAILSSFNPATGEGHVIAEPDDSANPFRNPSLTGTSKKLVS